MEVVVTWPYLSEAALRFLCVVPFEAFWAVRFYIHRKMKGRQINEKRRSVVIGINDVVFT